MAIKIFNDSGCPTPAERRAGDGGPIDQPEALQYFQIAAQSEHSYTSESLRTLADFSSQTGD